MQIKLTNFVSICIFCTFAPWLTHMRHVISMPKYLKTLAPVDSMSGMVGKRDETVSDKAFIVNVRKVGNVKNGGRPYMYFSLRQNDRNLETHPITVKEAAARQKFTQAVEATRARLIDPTKMAADQAAFLAQDKYPTIYGFVFSQEYESL